MRSGDITKIRPIYVVCHFRNKAIRDMNKGTYRGVYVEIGPLAGLMKPTRNATASSDNKIKLSEEGKVR